MGSQPGLPGSQFQSEDWIARELRELRQQIQQLAAANQLATAGIGVVPNGIVVNGSETVNGPLEVNGTMDVNDVANFGGAVSITGTLNLPAGIIGNDALANPLFGSAAGMTTTNQSFGTSTADYGTQLIAVPAGFTEAIVMNGVSAGGTNSTGSGDYIYVSSGINGSGGGETPTYAATGFYASASAFGIRTLTGLTAGSNISVSVRVRTNSGTWAAAAQNVVNVNALALFYR